MLQGYKCEHCSEFTIDIDLIETHENNCCFNPDRKCCPTCGNRELIGFVEKWMQIGCKADQDWMTIDDNNLMCSAWIPESNTK